MNGERHDEIAARLRREGGATAPDRLRADVMAQVRAEPRPRRLPRRRAPWRPLATLAAAACLLAAAVLGISRLPGGSASSSSGGASTGVAGLEARQSAGGGSGASLGAVRTAAPAPSRVVPGRTGSQSLQGSAAGALRQAPLPLRAAYEARARLAAPLPKAFELLSTGHVRGGR